MPFVRGLLRQVRFDGRKGKSPGRCLGSDTGEFSRFLRSPIATAMVITVTVSSAAMTVKRRARDSARGACINGNWVFRVSGQTRGDAEAAARRVHAVMGSELPIVFVRNRAKSNPTIEGVIAEFERQRRESH